MLKDMPALYQSDQFNKVCETFEKASGLTHSIPYDDYTKYIAACAFIRHGKPAGKTAEQFLKTFGWISSAPNGNVDWPRGLSFLVMPAINRRGKSAPRRK